MPFVESAHFFKDHLFRQIISGIPPESQTVLIQIRPDNSRQRIKLGNME